MEELYEKYFKEISDHAILFVFQIYKVGMIIKNHHFSEEKEWRLTAAPTTYYAHEPLEYKDDRIKTISIKDKEKHYIVAYIRELIENGVIKEIILGPKFDGDKEKLLTYLSARNCYQNVVVKCSDIPYV